MPGRRSLFWPLAVLLVAFSVLVIWLARAWGEYVELQSYHLTEAAQTRLNRYAAEAEQAWRRDGQAGVDRWLERHQAREPDWAVVVGPDLRSLGSRPLNEEEYGRLTFMRRVDWPMSKRSGGLPILSLPFPEAPDAGQLVMRLPERYLPGGFSLLARFVIHGVVPGALAFLLCVGLYRLLLAPLRHLREQANALRGNHLSTRVSPEVSRRRDELGELARAFDHMAERLETTVEHQRQLLCDLSHELRTPLSRLRVAGESELEIGQLRQRLEREVQCMQKLVDDTLELVWLDTERPQLPREVIDVASLWAVLSEDACFESGWPLERLRCELPADCRVHGNLNGLAQALENGLRNAIRHSPPDGTIRLGAQREDAHWQLWLEDEGGGVDPAQLEAIFRPFTRLSSARPGGEGFGLGLAIARGTLRSQGGDLWAENGARGLRLCLRLENV